MTWCLPKQVSHILEANHYLGPIGRGIAWHDSFGVIVVSSPTSRRVPGHWLELSRWCIVDKQKNSGSMQWAAFVKALRKQRPDVTTIVSYSDPSVGHTGALYRACNWLWAPTWHRLRPPPSGNGRWQEGVTQSVKDRWVFCLRRDDAREALLTARDESILRRMPWARYNDKTGASFKDFVAQSGSRA